MKFLSIVLIVLICNACQNEQRGLVVGKIQQASDLATTEFTIDKIVHGTKTKRLAWFIKLNEARFLAYSKVVIKTGIDLQKLKKEDIIIEGNSISVNLPSVEVINFSYPPEEFRIDDQITDTRKFLNILNLEDQEKLFQMAEIDVRNNLKYMGLVKATQQRTITLLGGLLRNLGYREVYINFKSDELIIDEVNLEE